MEPRPYPPDPRYKVYRDGRVLGHNGKELKAFLHRGYIKVSIGGQPTPIHRLLLWAYVGPKPEGMEGCHLDDVKTNNDLSNLRWGTRSDNQKDSVRNGHHKEAKKIVCSRGHLLKAPNLVENKETRSCKACHYTHARVNQIKRRKGIDLSNKFDELAMSRYERIMS